MTSVTTYFAASGRLRLLSAYGERRRPQAGIGRGPQAFVEIDPTLVQALVGIAAGSEVILLTWLHQGDRETLRVHPRDDLQKPLRGVFATRSPDRPNPIGLHRVRVLEIVESGSLRVEPLEAIDGTPVIDIKPVLSGVVEAKTKAFGVMWLKKKSYINPPKCWHTVWNILHNNQSLSTIWIKLGWILSIREKKNHASVERRAFALVQ